jgi:hypothetical protein
MRLESLLHHITSNLTTSHYTTPQWHRVIIEFAVVNWAFLITTALAAGRYGLTSDGTLLAAVVIVTVLISIPTLVTRLALTVAFQCPCLLRRSMREKGHGCIRTRLLPYVSQVGSARVSSVCVYFLLCFYSAL